MVSDRPDPQLFPLSLWEPNLRFQAPSHNLRSTNSRHKICLLKLYLIPSACCQQRRAWRSKDGGHRSYSALQKPLGMVGTWGLADQTDDCWPGGLISRLAVKKNLEKQKGCKAARSKQTETSEEIRQREDKERWIWKWGACTKYKLISYSFGKWTMHLALHQLNRDRKPIIWSVAFMGEKVSWGISLLWKS